MCDSTWDNYGAGCIHRFQCTMHVKFSNVIHIQCTKLSNPVYAFSYINTKYPCKYIEAMQAQILYSHRTSSLFKFKVNVRYTYIYIKYK